MVDTAAPVTTSSNSTCVEFDGVVWNQVAFRRFANREYARVLLETGGGRLLLQFGDVDAMSVDLITWRWNAPLDPHDAAALIGILSLGQAHAAVNIGAYVEQVALAKADLEQKIVALGLELRALKDGEPGNAALVGERPVLG